MLLFSASIAAAGDETEVIGRASVIDGDTIEIHGQRIRLHGIDAPESRQLCSDEAGEAYRCGQVAAFVLDDFLSAASPTTCHEVDRDRYGRMVARCTAGDQDVAEWLVRNGHALDWPKYSKGAYGRAQEAARAARAGIWRGRFEWPWEWRKARQPAG
nr:thermonuclease family protein [Mesorhizobium sp. L-8-3]